MVSIAGRVRVYFEGDATGTEVAAKKAEKAIDGVDGKTKVYTKSVDEQSRSVDRASASHDRYSRSVDNTGRSNDNASKSLRDVNTKVTALGHAIQLLKWPALITGAGYAAEGLGEVSAAAVGLGSALVPLAGLLIAYPGYLGALAQGAGVGSLALLGVTGVIKEMSTVQETAGTTAKESGKAQEAATEGVRSAEESLTAANRTAKDARTELNAAEVEAAANLRTLKDAAVDASLGEERAAENLHKAKAALRKAENEPTAKRSQSELSDLELSVREAQQSLKEAREGKATADRERAKGEKQGVGQNPEVVQARRALADANHQVGLAAHAVVKAEQTERESFEETGSAATRLQQKLASLPPAAQKFAKYIFGLKPQLKSLQSTAAAGLFPGVEKGINSALSLMPRLKTAVAGTAGVMGDLATKAGEFVGSKGFGRDFSTITKGNETLIDRLGLSGLKWADALRQVLVVGQPLLKWISKSSLEFSTWVDNAAKAGRKSGDLAGFFDKTRQVAEQLTTIVGNLAVGFFNVGQAAAPLGEDILDSFERSSQTFEDWTNSMKGKNELKAYFEDAKPGIFELGRLVRDASEDLIELSKGKGFFTMTRAVRTELLPVLSEMVGKTTEAFGPALVGALVQVGKLLGNLAGTSGPLTLFVNQVTSMLKAINWGFRNIPGLKTFVITLGGIATVAKALKFTGMVSGLSSSLGIVKKIAAWLGVIETKEAAVAATSAVSAGVGGVPVIAGAGRDLRTAEADVGAFGEKQALRDAGLLSGGAAASKSGSILSRLGLVGEEGLATGAGALTAGIGTVVVVTANSLLNPSKAGFSESEEKAHLDRAERRYLGNQEFNLDSGHTEKQFQHLQQTFAKTMAHLKAQAILGMGGINQALGTGLEEANATWAQGTPKWRAHTAEAMKYAVAEIKQGMHEGTISTEEGQKEINRLLARIHLVKGNDPWGLAEATTRQFQELNEITPAGISAWSRKLGQMPVVAREKSRQATEGMLEEWAAGHPKLEAQIKGLTDFEIQKFGATNKQIREGVKQGATGPVAEAFKEAAQGVGGALENIKVNANDMLKALGWSSLIKFRTHGFGPEAKLTGEAAKREHNFQNRAQGGYGSPGFLRGTGRRDTVPVMAAPGEAFLTQHQQPEVQVGLALAKAIGIGQNGSLEELFANRRTPHYMAKGGEVVGPRATATIAGAALNKIDDAVQRLLGRHSSHTGTPTGRVGWSGHTLTGKVSWFNGGATAGGRTTSDPGVALNLHPGTEGGWDNKITRSWMADSNAGHPDYVRVSIAGHRANLPIIDLGPAGFTQRAIDVTEGGVRKLGFTTSNFPTDAVGTATVLAQRFASGGQVGTASRAIAWARNNLGTQQGSRKEIKWANETGGIIDPWCAEFVGADMKAMGLPLPANPAYSGSYSEGWSGGDVIGSSLSAARPGDLLNFENEHIGIYLGGGRMISGNWSNQVALAKVSEDSHGLSAVIRPHYGGAGATAHGGRRGGRGGGAAPKSVKPSIGPATSTGAATTIGPATVAALGPLAAGVVSGAATWLPQQFKNELKQPGLNFSQKLAIANSALTYSEEEGTSSVGAASYGLELEEANETRLQKKLKTLNQELAHASSPKKRQALLNQRAGVLSSLGSVKAEIGNFRKALTTGNVEVEGGGEGPQTFTATDWANAELAEAELTPGKADDRAIEQKMLSLAEQRLAQAKNDRNPQEIAAAAQEVKQLRETLESTNALAEEQLQTSAELALAELTPETADDEAAKKKLLEIAEIKLQTAKEQHDNEAIIAAAGEVKQLREAVNASNEILQQREGFEKEQLDVNKRLAKIAEEQGPAFMGAFVAYLDGAIGGPLQTNSRLATAGVAAAYQQ